MGAQETWSLCLLLLEKQFAARNRSNEKFAEKRARSCRVTVGVQGARRALFVRWRRLWDGRRGSMEGSEGRCLARKWPLLIFMRYFFCFVFVFQAENKIYCVKIMHF